MLSMVIASSIDFPLSHSVAKEDDAIAEPQPNVLNLASVIFPETSSTPRELAAPEVDDLAA